MIHTLLFFSRIGRRRLGAALLLAAVGIGLSGCGSDSAELRKLQSRQQAKRQAATEVDHLRRASALIADLDNLDAESAADQINYHLNAWRQTAARDAAWEPTALLQTWTSVMRPSEADAAVRQVRFQPTDLDFFQVNYLLRQVSEWTQEKALTDPLIPRRLAAEADQLTDRGQRQLQLASRLFDWVVRNIRLEPAAPSENLPPAPELPAGMVFQGPGYRQTTFQTLWRGTGDWLQRADVFLQLCRHAGLEACLLAQPASESEPPREWMTAVLIDGKLFLFAPQFGIPVPGPGEEGIATLQEARQDESVLRRLRVPGVFDYPLDRNDIQQLVALLDATPEMLSERMEGLEQALTGEHRMRLSLAADAIAERLDAIPGIVGVRLWRIPVLSQQYAQALQKELMQQVPLALWYYINYAVLERGTDLYAARWKHLQGDFEGQEDALNDAGARVRYMRLRHPEYELEDLQIDVELQKKYGLRRELGETEESYQRKVENMLVLFRQAKRAATFWLGLLHVEDSRWEPAATWMDERVLGDPAATRWHAAARYNLARVREQQGELEEAIRLYKTDGDPQEHGNRLRARLIEYAAEKEPTPSS